MTRHVQPGARMTHDKLRGWLKLPDGRWPPDHYALIGLKRGAGTPDEIEAHVLERLELLRRYQLPHPDEATEGMNLLARALDTLTDPVARLAYDQSLGLTAPVRVAPPPPVDDPLDQLFPGVPILPVTPGGPVAIVEPDSILPEAILLPDVEDDLDLDIDDEPEFLEELPSAILMPVPPPIARLADARTPVDEAPRRQRSPKRERYADLARVRRVLRVWERARPYVTELDRTFARRTDALALMGCLAEMRPLLATVNDLIATGNRPGGIVAALARQRLLFDTLRSLLPEQREAFARDFRAAHFRLAAYYDDLRDEVARANQKDWSRTVGRPLLKYLADNPEWIVLPLAMLALAVAIVRSV